MQNQVQSIRSINEPESNLQLACPQPQFCMLAQGANGIWSAALDPLDKQHHRNRILLKLHTE